MTTCVHIYTYATLHNYHYYVLLLSPPLPLINTTTTTTTRIHPLNEELSALAHQHESGILSAYIDDVKAHSAAELIAGIIAIQQDKGPDFGAKLNMNKHRILLESC